MSIQTTIVLNDVDKLSQWDSGRTVKINNNNISIIHFSNDIIESIPVIVKDGIAEIPNILLQDSVPITAWAFVATQNGGYTEYHKQFDVIPKPRPLDYIYTETELASLALVLENIGKLDLLVTKDKDSLVGAINEIAKKTGITNHNDLGNRNLPDQHPMSSITGLQDALNSVERTFEAEINALDKTTQELSAEILKKQPKGDYLTLNTLPTASAEKAGIVQIDNKPIEGSSNAISSGAVYQLLGNAQQTISEITNILGAT